VLATSKITLRPNLLAFFLAGTYKF